MPDAEPRHWSTIPPAEAVDLVLPVDGVVGPLAEDGTPCPWPWEPQQLVGVPMGQYRCGYCGSMCVAGVRHPDYRNELEPPEGVGHVAVE